MHYLYYDAVISDTIEITGDELRHARALRLVKGEQLGLLNGQGDILTTTVQSLDKDLLILQLVDRRHQPAARQKIHMAVPLTKQIDRFEWFVEKATELGVSEITPLLCEHSERARMNQGRLQNIILSALKQCGRPWLPVLNELTTFKNLLHKESQGGIYLAHISGRPLKEMITQAERITLCIGPEGDFSESEMAMVTTLGLQLFSLGSYRLRTETAALTAAIQFMHLGI